MSHLLHLLAAAPTPADTSSLNALIAPGGGIAVILAVLTVAAKEFRAGRRENVEDANRRAKDAEAERDAIKSKRAGDIEVLQGEVRSLQDEVRKLHDEIRLLRESHDKQLADREASHREEVNVLHGRLVRETAVGWRLREALAQHGIPLPKDLDPDHPGEPHLDTAGPPT